MILPLSAIVGFSTARRALLCTLVDPTLRGVVVSGPVGTGKSTLMRSFGAFVREHVDAATPVVPVPLNVSDDRLLGGVDLDASVAAGAIRARAGLLAGAAGGYLFVDDLPLLEEMSIATIARALESETVITEREGISRRKHSRFVLLATTVPTERDLSLGVADRVAFLVGAEDRSDDATHLLLRRIERFNEHPDAFVRECDPAERRTAEQVTTARLLYPMVRCSEGDLQWIAESAERLAVGGNRAEIFAAKAARAHAALRGEREVGEGDLQFALATVLAPRAQNVPHEASGGDAEGGEGGDGENESTGGTPPPPTPTRSREDSGDGSSEDESTDDDGDTSAGQGMAGGADELDSRVLDPVDFDAPLPALAEFFAARRSTSAGRHGAMPQWQRGRHTRSIEGETRGRRIAIGATLRAAAPHQRSRGREGGDERLVIRGDDIRLMRFTQRSGTLFIFCVDASGSMAANRMREAKGAVTRLLQDAYVNRDTVALIAFRGHDAEVILPPTSSVERAKRSLDVLPTGGGTPLASALMKAYAMVELARRREVEQSIVVLLTDGRANVPMAENAAGMIMEVRRQHVRRELETIAVAYRRGGIRALVIDTRQSFGEASEAVRLAELLGARHFFLPRLEARELADVVSGAVRTTSRSSR
jgi:magnesium chelatase subunit D